MNSPLSNTVSPGVYLAFWWWQAGREAGSTSTGTSSHWQQRETRLEVLELPFSWPPFPLFLATLRSLPHFSPSTSPLCNVTSQEEASRGGFVRHQGPPFYPYETTVLTHWPDIINIASDHRPSSFSNNSSILRPGFFFFFSKQAFHLVSRDRYRAGIDLWFTIPFPFEEMALGSR